MKEFVNTASWLLQNRRSENESERRVKLFEITDFNALSAERVHTREIRKHRCNRILSMRL